MLKQKYLEIVVWQALVRVDLREKEIGLHYSHSAARTYCLSIMLCLHGDTFVMRGCSVRAPADGARQPAVRKALTVTRKSIESAKGVEVHNARVMIAIGVRQ